MTEIRLVPRVNDTVLLASGRIDEVEEIAGTDIHGHVSVWLRSGRIVGVKRTSEGAETDWREFQLPPR